MTLDLRTIGIFSAITPFVLGFIMLIYLKERKVYGGFRHWIWANFGLCAGFTLVSLPNFIPNFLSILVGNILIVYSIILIYEGIEHFYERSAISWMNYLVLVSYILLLLFFTYPAPNPNARVAFSSLTVCLLILQAGSRLFDVPINGLERTSRSAGYVFFVTALFPWVRAITSLFTSGPLDLFSDILNSWFAMIFVASIVTWTFYFFFLNSARLELDLKTASEKLNLISRTDPLTNLYNRRHFDEQAEIEIQRSKRFGQSNTLLLLDIDGFKSINDMYGHAVGDVILKSLSLVLRSELRPFDLIARYGGDEFVIMLSGTNQDQAYAIAERIRNRVRLTPFIFNSHIYRVTLSAGLTTVDSGDTDLRSILKRGDVALYLAKEHGRNCVMIA